MQRAQQNHHFYAVRDPSEATIPVHEYYPSPLPAQPPSPPGKSPPYVVQRNESAPWLSPIRRRMKNKKGGFSRCCKWTCCLCITLVVAIAVLVYFLFPRKPGVNINRVGPLQQSNQPVVGFENAGERIYVNLQLDGTVNNPNYFGVNLKDVIAKGYYSGDSKTLIATGRAKNLEFPRKSNKTFTFPFRIVWDSTTSPQAMYELVSKCGLFGAQYKGKLPLRIMIDVNFKVVGISGSVNDIPINYNADCPVDLAAADPTTKQIILQKLNDTIQQLAPGTVIPPTPS